MKTSPEKGVNRRKAYENSVRGGNGVNDGEKFAGKGTGLESSGYAPYLLG